MEISLSFFDGNESILDKSFSYLISLIGYRDQLRINHWQTISYAEHKLTDEAISIISEYIDKIGEAVLGILGRPKINTRENSISDISICSTEYTLKCICDLNKEMISVFKETEYEGIFSLLGELEAEINKFTYLSTLK